MPRGAPKTGTTDGQSAARKIYTWADGPQRVFLVAAFVTAAHIATNGRYGFHRDELQFLADARFGHESDMATIQPREKSLSGSP